MATIWLFLYATICIHYTNTFWLLLYATICIYYTNTFWLLLYATICKHYHFEYFFMQPFVCTIILVTSLCNHLYALSFWPRLYATICMHYGQCQMSVKVTCAMYTNSCYLLGYIFINKHDKQPGP